MSDGRAGGCATPARAVRVVHAGGHIPALDGLRGVAIILVVVYHAARGLPYVGSREQVVQSLVNLGWVGVDLFFVLSGFLITGILLDAKGGSGYFRTFYGRRVLRIFPLYLTYVAFVVWLAPALGLEPPRAAAQLRGEQAWYWSYMVNALVARWGWASAPWHTAHLWSLSVEEQFYLVWPALVFALSRRNLIRTAVGIAAAAMALRVLLVSTAGASVGVYVLLPTRMDGLALGAVLAGLARERDAWPRLRRWAPAVAGGAILTLTAIFRREWLLPSGTLTEMAGYAALALLSAAAVVSAVGAAAGTVAASLWTNPLLRFFGRYSYGLYVWHQVTIAMLQEHLLPPGRLPLVRGSHLPGYVLFVALAFLLCVGVALVSWHALEYPFLQLKRLLPYRRAAPSRGNAAVPPTSSEWDREFPHFRTVVSDHS